MTFMDLALGGLRRLGTPVFTMLWVVWRAVAQVLVAALLDDDLADRSLGWVPAFVALHAAANLGYAWGQWRDTFTTSDGHVIVRTANGCHFTVPPPPADDSLQGLGLGPREDASALLPTVAPAPDIELAVAVVVPVLVTDAADLEQLSKLVARLLGQTLPPRHVVIVDDGSPVEVATRTKALMTSTTGSEIEVVRLQCNRGPAVARNAGVDRAVALNFDAAAAGKLVVFLTDLDCLPLEDWIELGVAAVAARRPFLVNAPSSVQQRRRTRANRYWSEAQPWGPIPCTLSPPITTALARLLVLRDLDVAAVAVQPLYAPTCNLVLYLGDGTSSRLPRFNERFREASMEDVLFCLQAWAQRHIEFAVQEDMQVEHVYAGTGESFLRRVWLTFRTFRKYGRWARACAALHAGYMTEQLGRSIALPSHRRSSLRPSSPSPSPSSSSSSSSSSSIIDDVVFAQLGSGTRDATWREVLCHK